MGMCMEILLRIKSKISIVNHVFIQIHIFLKILNPFNFKFSLHEFWYSCTFNGFILR